MRCCGEDDLTGTLGHHDRLREPSLLQQTPPGFEIDQWMVGTHGVIGPLGPALGQTEGDVESRQRSGALDQHQPSAGRQQACGVTDRRREIGRRVENVGCNNYVEGAIDALRCRIARNVERRGAQSRPICQCALRGRQEGGRDVGEEIVDAVGQDRKSTRLNSSHMSISYAVFCLLRRPPSSTLFPYTTLFRSGVAWRTLAATTTSKVPSMPCAAGSREMSSVVVRRAGQSASARCAAVRKAGEMSVKR